MRIEQEFPIKLLQESQFTETERRKPEEIDTIVIHSMYNPNSNTPYTAQACKEILDEYEVSTHYIIDREGQIWQLVPEEKMAWHAGISRMPDPDGREKVNRFSIGIELVGNYTDGFTDQQHKAVSTLVIDIINRHPITAVVGHNDIAGAAIRRNDIKTDPWNFDWQRFGKDLQNNLRREKMPIIRSAQFRL